MAKREHYRNGDEITLTSCGCDGCAPSRINGVLCHESGCPDAWRDYQVACYTCGDGFFPEEKGIMVCPDCRPDNDE